ncbi:MAG: hypothetical protein IH589_19245 [Anaerolineales bacterium]|nr:hypothetical protein [Anaerolineales bacterium]
MSTTFYEASDRLEQLKKREDISQAEISETIKYLEEEKFARYFFMDLENPAWVLPLHENKFFLKVPPPLEDPNNPGYFSMPTWYAGEYLKRMADKFPDIVRDIALSLETDNSRALRTILEVLLKVPVDITAEIVGKFQSWIETPFSNFMMLSRELGIIMEYLAKGGKVQAALATLSILLEPVQVKDRFDEGKLVASTRHDFYWLSQALQLNLPVLTKMDPNGVVNVAEEQLIKAIDSEHDPRIDDNVKKLNSYWRLRISPRSETNYDNEIKNILVNTIIASLTEGYAQKPRAVHLILSRYIDSDYSIFRRIAIYMLQSWGKQYKDLIEKAYIAYREHPIHAGQSEFYSFVEAQYSNFSQSIKEEILFDRKNPDAGFVEEILNGHPEGFAGNTKEEKRKTLIETWQLRELTPLASYLEADEKEYYEKLLGKYGEPSPKPDDEPVTVSFVGEKSPIESDEFVKKSIIGVVQYLVEYVPTNNAPFGEPSREGLANILENDIQARLNDYTNQATSFINNDLRFIYHTHFLRGIKNAVKKQEKFELDGIIAVCEHIVKQKAESYQQSDFEEGLPAAKLAIVQLFEELFRVKELSINDDLLERSGKIIVELLHQREPFPDNEDAQGYDPATHSLNCLHGVAMHSLVSYGLYCERKRKQEADNKGTPIMIPLLKKTLAEKLDKRKNRSLAVHSIYGWYFPQFIYLDKEWALEHSKRIFFSGSSKKKYWQAAWSAYIRFSDVYTNVFPELISQYKKALKGLPASEQSHGLDTSNEKMATHILKAYLVDMIKLNSRDGLLRLYYQMADDETRSHGNFWLSKVLESRQPSVEDVTWKKIWGLWQWRTEVANDAENKGAFTKEISSFSRLLKNVPVNLLELNSIIEQTLTFKSDGFETQEIIEFLGKHSEKFPNLAVSNLHKIVLSSKQFYLLEDTKKGVEQTLTSAMNSDDTSRAKAIEIINVFGERGDYSWRQLLEVAK